MHGVSSIHVLKSFYDIFQKSQSLALTQFFLLLKVGPQISALAEFSDDVHIVVGLVDIEQLDDILMFEFLHDLDLIVDVFEVVLVGEDTFFNHLHSNSGIVRGESAEEDGGVGAFAEEVVHGVDVFLYFFLALGEVLAFEFCHSR